MNKSALLVSRNLFKFLFVFLALASLSSLSSCSSTQFASNFGKRKYTAGRFSDPVAKVKTEPSPGFNIPVVSVNQPSAMEIQTSVPQLKPVKQVLKVLPKQSLNFDKQLKTAISAVAKNPIWFIKDNVSLIEASVASPPRHGDYGGAQPVRPIRYLGYFFLCLGIAIVFGFLALLEISGSNSMSSNEGLGIVCGAIAYIALIAAAVFLIIFIVKGLDSLQH